jgi:hypothetical protein
MSKDRPDHNIEANPPGGTPSGERPLREVIAAFPGVLGVELTEDRVSPGKHLVASIHTGDGFDFDALERHLREVVPLLTLARLRLDTWVGPTK